MIYSHKPFQGAITNIQITIEGTGLTTVDLSIVCLDKLIYGVFTKLIQKKLSESDAFLELAILLEDRHGNKR